MGKKEAILMIKSGQPPERFESPEAAARQHGMSLEDIQDILNYGGRHGKVHFIYEKNYREPKKRVRKTGNLDDSAEQNAPAVEEPAPPLEPAPVIVSEPEYIENSRETGESTGMAMPDVLPGALAKVVADPDEENEDATPAPEEIIEAEITAPVGIETAVSHGPEQVQWWRDENPHEPTIEELAEGERCFIPTVRNEYWILLKGATLSAAKGRPVYISLSGGGRVDLQNTAWLNNTTLTMQGICGSIRCKKFNRDAYYVVFFVPHGAPPYLYAVEINLK